MEKEKEKEKEEERVRSEEHTSELKSRSVMSYAVFSWRKKNDEGRLGSNKQEQDTHELEKYRLR